MYFINQKLHKNRQIKQPNNVSCSIIYRKNMLIKVKTSIQLILELISDSMKMGHQHLFKWALAPAITVVGGK